MIYLKKNYNAGIFLNTKAVFFSAVFLFALLTPSTSFAAEYYIDPLNGNDINDGSALSPKLSLNGLRLKLQPGDTVYLMDTAVYSGSQGMFAGVSGTENNPITIKAAPGAHPVFKGCGLYNVYMTLTNWWVLDGIVFDKPDNPNECAQRVTVDVLIAGSHNVVKNCTMSKSSTAGIRVDKGDYNLLENNVGINTGSVGGGFGSGDFIVLRGSKFNVIKENTIYSSGHAGIQLLDYPNFVRLSTNNEIIGNIIDQTVTSERNGGGGGIYLGMQSDSNNIEGNLIKGVGNMPGLTQNKAGIDIASGNNVIRYNTIESYGVPGSAAHRGLYLVSNVSGGFANTNSVNNVFESNIVGPGYGLPLYVREGIGSRASGAVVANNTFKNNTLTAPIEPILHETNDVAGNYIGMYTPGGKYFIYMGSYTDGAWPVFANGNVFEDTKFVGDDGSGKIGYYYGGGGFGKTIAQVYSDFPLVFYNEKPAKSYNISDFNNLAIDWLQVKSSVADLNSDGIINSIDLGKMMSYWQ